jgi:hypothetical protein
MNKKIISVILVLLGIIIIWFVVSRYLVGRISNVSSITTYEECVAAGNPVMESYPEHCRANGTTYTRDVGNAVEKMDKIRITSPAPGAWISSPLTITGEARGNWMFEASFPVILTDWDGKIIAEGHAEAQGDWMTTEFVPFKATITFTKPTQVPNNRGTLILKKDNPSGLPQNDDALEIPVYFN